MDTSLTVEYDKAGDILYLGKTKSYPEQDSEELDYGSWPGSIRRRTILRILRSSFSLPVSPKERPFTCP